MGKGIVVLSHVLSHVMSRVLSSELQRMERLRLPSGEKLLRKFALFFILLASFLAFNPAFAAASIHQYEGLSGGVLYRSQQSLRDRSGHNWQVVFFREFKAGEKPATSLRLVGFPGQVEVDHSQPMEVLTATGESLIAPDQFAQSAPAVNVGQYDFATVPLPNEATAVLRLVIPLKGQAAAALRIPGYVIQEWRQIHTQVSLSGENAGLE